jgi:transcriptional regulator with XRE-family HTH domain
VISLKNRLVFSGGTEVGVNKEVILAEALKAARGESGLTQAEAAGLLYTSTNNWQNWEQGRYPMPPGLYELFLLKTGRLLLLDVVLGAEENKAVRQRTRSGDARRTPRGTPNNRTHGHWQAIAGRPKI